MTRRPRGRPRPFDRVRPLDLERAPAGSVAGRGATSLLGLAAQGAIRLGVSVAIGRLAGQATLGVVAAGMASAQLLILLGPTTSGQAASRFLARSRGRAPCDGSARAEMSAVAGHLARRVLLLSGLLGAAAFALTLWRGESPAAGVVVALFLAGLAGQQFTRGVHYGVGAVTRVVALDVAFSALGFVGVVATLLAGARGTGILLPLALAYLALTAACWPWSSARGCERSLAREIDRFVAFGSLGTIASAGLVQISILLAERLGAHEAGRYAAAWNLALPLTLGSSALGLVLYPTMAEAWGRGERSRVADALDRAVRGLVFVVVGGVGVLALLAEDLVTLVYGPRFAGAGTLLALQLLGVGASMVAVPCVNAMTSGGRRGIAVIAAVSWAGLTLAALVWVAVVPVWGVHGVALGYAAGTVAIAAVAVGHAWRAWRPRWLPSFAAAAAATACVAAAPLLLADRPVWTRLAIAGVGLLVWVAARPRERRLWLGVFGRD